MSDALWTIGIVAYCLLVMATWCAGAFGIAATASERQLAAYRRAEAEWCSPRYVKEYAFKYARAAVFPLSLLTFAGGLLWPVAIPLYLAYRKGAYINDALVKRQQLTKERAS